MILAKLSASSTGFGPMFLTTMTKLFAGWPAILAKLCAVFLRLFVEPPTCFRVNCAAVLFVASQLLRGLQIAALYAVLFVDCEEYLCILLGSLPGARRAIVCILFSLEQSRVVD